MVWDQSPTPAGYQPFAVDWLATTSYFESTSFEEGLIIALKQNGSPFTGGLYTLCWFASSVTGIGSLPYLIILRMTPGTFNGIRDFSSVINADSYYFSFPSNSYIHVYTAVTLSVLEHFALTAASVVGDPSALTLNAKFTGWSVNFALLNYQFLDGSFGANPDVFVSCIDFSGSNFTVNGDPTYSWYDLATHLTPLS